MGTSRSMVGKRTGKETVPFSYREPLAPAWRDLLVVLRTMESRGEIRGGRFVSAYLGEQFAMPEALDLLRAVRRTGETAAAPEGPGPWAALHAPVSGLSNLSAAT